MPGTTTALDRSSFAVLFDLDGTVIDTLELLLSSARYAFEGWPSAVPTDAEWLRGIGTPLVTQMRAYAKDEEEVAQLIERYRAYQRVHHDRLTRCYDDVPGVIQRLHGESYRLGVVTSKANHITHMSLAHVGLDRFFEVVVGFDDTTRHKPHPEPVETALRRLSLDAGQAVYVGDSPYDIESGNAAGVTTIAALWGAFDRETLATAHPNHFIERMADLPDVLTRIFPIQAPQT